MKYMFSSLSWDRSYNMYHQNETRLNRNSTEKYKGQRFLRYAS